jgi:hypothetical protein
MRNILNLAVCALVVAGLLLACKKENATPVPSSSLTIVNALWAGDTLVTNFNPGSKADSFSYRAAGYIAPGNYQEFSGYFGNVRLALSQIDDTTNTVYNGAFDIAAGSTHTLFIAGSPAAPDSLFTTDQVPVIKDTSLGIRFVNLLSGNIPVSVDVLGGNSLNGNLPYKGITSWQLLPAGSANSDYPTYTFEFRNVSTSALLASRIIVPVMPGTTAGSIYSKSVTIVLKGNPDSTGINGPATVLVNNY